MRHHGRHSVTRPAQRAWAAVVVAAGIVVCLAIVLALMVMA